MTAVKQVKTKTEKTREVDVGRARRRARKTLRSDLGDEHGNDGAHGGHEMKGFLGPYGMGREGSGTRWEPGSRPMTAFTRSTGTG